MVEDVLFANMPITYVELKKFYKQSIYILTYVNPFFSFRNFASLKETKLAFQA